MAEEYEHPIKALLSDDIYNAVSEGRLPNVRYDISVKEDDENDGIEVSWSHVKIKCVLPAEYLNISKQSSFRNKLLVMTQAYMPKTVDQGRSAGLLVEIRTFDEKGNDMLETIIDDFYKNKN